MRKRGGWRGSAQKSSPADSRDAVTGGSGGRRGPAAATPSETCSSSAAPHSHAGPPTNGPPSWQRGPLPPASSLNAYVSAVQWRLPWHGRVGRSKTEHRPAPLPQPLQVQHEGASPEGAGTRRTHGSRPGRRSRSGRGTDTAPRGSVVRPADRHWNR